MKPGDHVTYHPAGVADLEVVKVADRGVLCRYWGNDQDPGRWYDVAQLAPYVEAGSICDCHAPRTFGHNEGCHLATLPER